MTDDERNDVKKPKAVLEAEAAVIAKPDTDLDLDDVAAISPKAKSELDALREQVRRLEQELKHFRSQHTHGCIRCRYQYTPKEWESEDCPVCGCDGTLENEHG